MKNTNNAGFKRSLGAKGDVTIFEDAGRLKVNLPRSYFGGKQLKRALKLQATDENWAIAYRIAKRMTLDLQEGCFDTSLEKSGIKANLKLVTTSDNLPPKPRLGTLEIWDKYLEYKKPTLKENTFIWTFQRSYTATIVQAIECVGDDAVAIRAWILSNRSLVISRRVLSHLSYAYQLSIKQGLATVNPFNGMVNDLPKKENQKVENYDNDKSEQDLYDPSQVKKKAFTTAEVDSILKYVQDCKGKAFFPILQFLFLTGCRTNEATALMWGDIKWNKEFIVIQRSYSPRTKKFISTKTGHIRLFPMPKYGELWQLLKSLDVGESNEVVFKTKRGHVINSIQMASFWRGTNVEGCKYPGVIPTLIKQGKVSKYLPLYNTRRTFISYQINECGVSPHVVKDWCGHSEDVTTKIYRQEDLLTKPVGYNSKPVPNQPSEPSRIEVLEQQVQLLMEQNKMLQEIIVNLETRSSANNATIATED